MEYLIVEAHSARELQSKVQEYIEQGWEPLGGLSVATHGPLGVVVLPGADQKLAGASLWKSSITS